MNKEDLVIFLKKFDISKEIIDDYFKDKLVIEENGNIFLSNSNSPKNQFDIEDMLFINLEELVPTRTFLEFIKNNTKNIIKVSSDKQIQRVLYSQDLSIDAINKNISFDVGKLYIVTNLGKVLGVIEYLGKGKFPYKNVYNLGQYLREK